jgi:hypothetical protein
MVQEGGVPRQHLAAVPGLRHRAGSGSWDPHRFVTYTPREGAGHWCGHLQHGKWVRSQAMRGERNSPTCHFVVGELQRQGYARSSPLSTNALCYFPIQVRPTEQQCRKSRGRAQSDVRHRAIDRSQLHLGVQATGNGG